MPITDKKIDTYIAKSPEFARLILTTWRAIVHQACPDVEETVKWSCPHFMYKGKMLCSMAAFKEHCRFHFWRGSQIVDEKDNKHDESDQFGRLASLRDLPPKKTLVGYIHKAMQLTDDGVKTPLQQRSKPEKKELVVPAYFTVALKKNKKAQATFDHFSYSHKKEYVEWITEAKTEETRERRMATALEWIAEGKSRNWKYEKC